MKEQYETSGNLEKRIRLHDYSTSSQSWMEWVYDGLKLQENEQVLELGCGTGLLWQTNIRSAATVRYARQAGREIIIIDPNTL